METKLKPCPFCGSTDVCRLLDFDDEYERKYCNAVMCQACKVRTPFFANQKAAIDLWNKRYKEEEE